MKWELRMLQQCSWISISKNHSTNSYINTLSICSTQNSVVKYTYIKCTWINKPRTLNLWKVLVETSSMTCMLQPRNTNAISFTVVGRPWQTGEPVEWCQRFVIPPMDRGLQMKKRTTFKPPVPIKLHPGNSYRLLSHMLHPPFPLQVDVTNICFYFCLFFLNGSSFSFNLDTKVKFSLILEFGKYVGP